MKIIILDQIQRYFQLFPVHLFFFLLIPITAFCSNQYQFRTLSPQGGFYYDGVSSILQDGNGFIWVLMENNLYRFDGYQYKYYYNRFFNIAPSKEWLFTGMTTNSKGKLFVNTNNGLYVYDRISDTFYSIWEQPLESFMIDAYDSIWIKQNTQWGILNVENKTVYIPLFDGKKPPHYIGSVTCLNNDDLYLFSNYGRLFRFNNVKKEFSFCMVLPEHDGLVVKAIAHKGKLWALTGNYGLYKIDLSSFLLEDHFDLGLKSENRTFRSFCIDKKGEIWLGTINGLYILNPETKEYTHHQHSESDPHSIPSNSIWSVNEDRQRNIWIGMYSGKICYVNLDEKNPFITYLTEKYKLGHLPVSAFTEDQQYLWVGTEGGGISRIDKNNGECTYYTYTGKNNDLSSTNIKSMVIDRKQNVWIATYQGGLNCYNPEKQQFFHFIKGSKDNFLLNNNIKKMIHENDSGLWIIYQQQKPVISFYSFRNNTFIHYNLFPEKKMITFDIKNSTSYFYIFDILRGRENQLWVLSREKIYIVDTKRQTMKELKNPDKIFMNFSAFCFDDSGSLWIGTIGNGLVNYNPDRADFTIYKEVLNYGISSIYSICNDDEGNIWMGTDNGLIRYDTVNNIFSHYNKQNGIQGQVYYPLASMKGKNGKLYFGSTTGLTIINPKNIVVNNYKPRVILSNFLINNVPVDFPFYHD
ncbi:MAG: hybrid sensor histidine kinase/response regulator, partial [Dysgonamonadaceae bacterium]|nr:hybrid sensor histidine kinase/response regulator [Dysgonamonadaceae bacterium]